MQRTQGSLSLLGKESANPPSFQTCLHFLFSLISFLPFSPHPASPWDSLAQISLATPAFIYPPDKHRILHASPTSSPCGHPYTPFLSFPNNWTFSEFFTAHRLHFFLYPHLPLPPVVKSLSSQNIRSFIPSALSSFFVFSWFCLQWPLAWAECQGHFHFPLGKTTHLM